ncbi:hypothetical protein BIY29_05650 [Brenneria alni]|uniref:Uncharacterized protein n=1 Tax=Brenneria alni TaxID=71656 RepID=A0A421DR40_9GAMM|nr:hypothetical protein [Brenneria alni]RLM26541.1 hypothetical protein BIY29_05650 [Brenneria alni]
MTDLTKGWRCFHCGEYFDEHQAHLAKLHFGQEQNAVPRCKDSLEKLSVMTTAFMNLQRISEVYRTAYEESKDRIVELQKQEPVAEIKCMEDLSLQVVNVSDGFSLGRYPVYAAPVPPAVPDQKTRQDYKISPSGLINVFDHGHLEGWNACRAAMLQLSGNAEPVSKLNPLPKNKPCTDAPEKIWLQTAGEWPAGGVVGDMTWCDDSQHPDDTLYIRADFVGNSPVIPDGWVLVPAKATYAMIRAAGRAARGYMEEFGGNNPSVIYSAMLAAAPQPSKTTD